MFIMTTLVEKRRVKMKKKNLRWYRVLHNGQEVCRTHSPLNYLKLWVKEHNNADIVFVLEGV